MEAETLNQIFEGVRVGGVILGGLAAVLGFDIAFINHQERLYKLNKLNELYDDGKLDVKPTYFNIDSFYEGRK